MSRCSLTRRVACALACLALIELAHAQPPGGAGLSYGRAGKEKNIAELRRRLDDPVRFGGFDDPETKLDDVLQYLQRAYNFRFDVNDKAFKEDKVENVREHAIGKPIAKMNNVSLNTVLRKVLDRIPTESTTMWLVRDGWVELTTVRAYRAEFYAERPEGPFPPLVLTTFDKKPLDEALKQLADETDANIVLDAVRAADKAKTPVTARLTNVPVDTAVYFLADMAGLKSVEVDGVYYVTSRENAVAVREERAKARPGRAEPAKPAKIEKMPRERDEQIRRLKATVEDKPPDR